MLVSLAGLALSAETCFLALQQDPRIDHRADDLAHPAVPRLQRVRGQAPVVPGTAAIGSLAEEHDLDELAFLAEPGIQLRTGGAGTLVVTIPRQQIPERRRVAPPDEQVNIRVRPRGLTYQKI